MPATTIRVLVVVALGTVAVVRLEAQTAVGLHGVVTGRPPTSAAVPDGRPRTFERTPDGDWKTVIAATPTTPAREYVFVPPTKVDPVVTVEVALDGGSPRPLLRYRYRVENSPGARQALARLFVHAGEGVSVDAIPDGWTHHTPQRGAVSLSGPLRGRVPEGLPPGTEAIVELSGPTLPGLVTVGAGGDTAGAVEVPPGLTEQQYLDLSEISRRATVDVVAVGPAIPAGLREPELGFAVLLARVKLHYSEAIRRYGHPHAEALLARLDALRGVSATDAAVRAALGSLRELAQAPVEAAAARQISAALEACAAALLTGAFPVR